MKKYIFLLLWIPILGFAQNKPNILFILMDDLGYGDVGFNNPDCFWLTEDIDDWAKESLVLTHHFSEQVCTVSRTTLLCAISASAQGRDGWNYRDSEMKALPQQRTIFTEAQAAGYITSWFGKGHLGSWGRYRPTERNINYHFGLYDGSAFRFEPTIQAWNEKIRRTYDFHEQGKWWVDSLSSFKEYVFVNSTAVATGGTWSVRKESCSRYNDDIFTEKALDFMWTQHRGGKRFFTFLALIDPHSPMMGLKTDVYAEAARLFPESSGNYTTPQIMCATRGVMIQKMNDNLKRIRDNLPPNTLVVFTSDNGGLRPDNPNNIAGVLGNIIGSECSDIRGLKGGKGVHTGGGLLVPAFVYWPEGGIQAGISSQPVFSIDWFPTLTVLMRGKVKGKYEGRDILPMLKGLAPNPHIGDTVILSAGLIHTWAAAVVSSDSKVHIYKPNELSWQAWNRNVNSPMVYNLHDDINETTNIYLSKKATYNAVKAYVENYSLNITHYLGNDQTPIWYDSLRVVGEWPRVLPPR